MAKTKAKKEEEIKNLKKIFSDNKLVILSLIEGLKVKDSEMLRKNLHQEKAGLFVMKKTLLKRSLKDLKVDQPDYTSLKGIVGLAYGPDEVSAAKTLKDFSKDHPEIQLVGGYLEDKYIGSEMVNNLATLPSRDQLIAQTVYTIKAPITGLVNVLAGNLRGLVTALKAISDCKTN